MISDGERCPSCDGQGWRSGSHPFCPTCSGLGSLDKRDQAAKNKSLLQLARRIAEARGNVFDMDPRDWEQFAACRNAITQDPWFPSREDAARMGPDLKYALAHCASCPVRRECLQAGMTSGHDTEGIWGGAFSWEFGGVPPTKDNIDILLEKANMRIAAWGLGRVFAKEEAS